MALRRCPGTRCPHLVPQGRRCPEHQAEYEAKRGTPAQRGYGVEHKRERLRWEAIIGRRPVYCARCDKRIKPGDAWDLGHTDDRSGYNGPECMRCNRSAGGKNGAKTRNSQV